MGITDEVVSHVSIKASSMATYGGAGSAIFFGLTANEFAAIGGLLVAVIAALVNIALTYHFKQQHLELARQRAKDANAAGEGND